MRLDFMKQTDERQLVEQIGRLQRDPIQEVLDPPEIRGTGSTDDADDFVLFSSRSSAR